MPILKYVEPEFYKEKMLISSNLHDTPAEFRGFSRSVCQDEEHIEVRRSYSKASKRIDVRIAPDMFISLDIPHETRLAELCMCVYIYIHRERER